MITPYQSVIDIVSATNQGSRVRSAKDNNFARYFVLRHNELTEAGQIRKRLKQVRWHMERKAGLVRDAQ